MKKKSIALFLALTLSLSPVAVQAELLSDGDLLTSQEELPAEETDYAWEDPVQEEEDGFRPEGSGSEEYVSEEFETGEAVPEGDLLWDGVYEEPETEDGLSEEELSEDPDETVPEEEEDEEGEIAEAGDSAHWVYKNGAFSYYDEDGEKVPVSELTYPVKQYGYFEINGAYYALDKNGKPRTGLVYINKIPYYFRPETSPAGQMFMAGWQKFDLPKGEKWIFFKAASAGDEDKGKGEVPGMVRLVRIPRISNTLKCVLDHNNYIKKNAMITINGKVYITDPEGKVYKNTFVKKGGYRYYVGSDGAVQTWKNQWVKNSNTNNTWYYYGSVPGRVEEKRGFQAVYNSSGKYVGWEFFNDKGNPVRNTYKGNRYFGDNGIMASGITTVRGITRFFEESTSAAPKGEYYHGRLFTYKGAKYYAQSGNGALFENGWITVSGYTRCFENFRMIVNSFRNYNGENVYLSSSGLITKGWVIFSSGGNKVKYVNPNGNDFYKSTWATIGGLQYYFDAQGFRMNDVSSMVGGPYYVKVDRVNCVATVYNAAGTIPVRSIRISPGAAGTPTPLGTYYLRRSARWQSLMGPSWGQYGTNVVGAGKGGIFFHSIPCSTPSLYNVPDLPYSILGHPASHGCIRCCVADAKFIYDYCNGARVTIFDGVYTSKEVFKGPLGRNPLVPKTSGADPTDPLA